MIPLDTPDLLQTIAGQWLQYGVLGAVCLAALYGNWLQWQAARAVWEARIAEIKQVSEARVAEARANTAAFAELTKGAATALVASTAATEANTEAVRDLREALRRGTP